MVIEIAFLSYYNALQTGFAPEIKLHIHREIPAQKILQTIQLLQFQQEELKILS